MNDQNQPLLRRIVQAVGGDPDRNDSENTLLFKWADAVWGALPPIPTPDEDNMIHQISVSLDNTQIKALGTTPFEIVPPTEILNYSGIITRLPIIVRGVVHWEVNGGVGYGNINVANMGVFVGSDALGVGPVSYTINAANFFAATDISLWALGISSNGGTASEQWSLEGSNKDNGLYLALQFNGGNLTGGHATNRIRVSLNYVVYNRLTGQFE